MKFCRKCQSHLDTIHFSKRHNTTDGLAYYCKKCYKAYGKSRRQRIKNTPNRIFPIKRKQKFCPRCKKEKEGKFFSKSHLSSDGLQSWCKSCSYLRKDKYKKARNSYHKKRRVSDVSFKISSNLRSRVSGVLRKNQTKAGSFIRDLGCSVEELKSHLESKFLPGMSWNNYGNNLGCWSIDHIIPLSAFNLSDRQHFILAAHYKNLQPLWHEDNLAKSSKY